jgi:HAMP domain-containing protein
MILFIFRKFFVFPIRIIGEAAAAISKGENVTHIDIHSRDELGNLARNMEAMSFSIQKQRSQIQKHHDELETRVKERTEALEKALSEIKTLSGILPICAHCKKIRDDKGYWNQIEAYVRDHSEADFTHSICQECAKKFFPDINIYDE